MTPPSPPNFVVRHFWPRPAGEARSALAPPAFVRFPCGTPAAGGLLVFATNNPGDVTCRRCARSHLVQGLLLRGRSDVVLDVDGLELWGLIRR